jgi:hypothetical protein
VLLRRFEYQTGGLAASSEHRLQNALYSDDEIDPF